MTARLWVLAAGELRNTECSAASLDELSLDLPAGAYTTMRTYGGDRVVALSRHLERLATSLAMTGGHRTVDGAVIRAGLRQLIERENQNALRLRITVPFTGNDVLISCENFTVFPADYYSHGVVCRTILMGRDTPMAKTTAFIAPSRAIKANAPAEIYELIRIDERGMLLEGLSSNFFAVKGGVLRTAGEGILDGVTRGVVLAIAQDVLLVVQQPIGLADLPHLEEAFITSATREVMPVVRIDDAVIGAGVPGEVTCSLLASYRSRLDCDAERV